ncbi:MAG: GlyGly-CTERM sorting domain-containing protein [Aquificae bacterium]|nr:GlyGly-CTERM sorting domain-containing protein [Aquificota bacterium]
MERGDYFLILMALIGSLGLWSLYFLMTFFAKKKRQKET